jgi:6-phosphogluconolactonase
MIEHTFPDREAAASALAARIAMALQRRLAREPTAAFVISGGSSPMATYAHLSYKDLEWHRVQVLLSDERWVAPTHDDSNEKMLRKTLLRSRAASLGLLPFYAAETTVENRCEAISQAVRALPLPFACALLGMGEDGHFASLFPDIGNLREGLDPDSRTLCIPVTTRSSPHRRISLTLAALTLSDEILLLIYGKTKRTVVDRAAHGDAALPVSKLFAQQRAPVHLFWAP